MGASVGSDIYGTYKPRSRDKLTNVIRLGVLFSILVSYIICYMLPHDIIARGTSIFMGICAAAFLPAYFCIGYLSGAVWQGCADLHLSFFDHRSDIVCVASVCVGYYRSQHDDL